MKIIHYGIKSMLVCLLLLVTSNLMSQCTVANTNGAATVSYTPGGLNIDRFGQSFTATCNGILGSITIKCTAPAVGTSFSGTLTVSEGINPFSNIIYNQPFTATVGSGGITTVTLSSPPTLTNGNSYVFLFTPTSNATIVVENPGSYSGGKYTYAQTAFSGSYGSNIYDLYFSLNLPTCIPTTSTKDTIVCSNALPFIWNDKTVSASGVFKDTLTNAKGCDSVPTLNVNVSSCMPLNALSFDGINDYVQVAHNNVLNSSSYTLECWINPNNFNYLGGFISKYNAGGSFGYRLSLNSTAPYTGINFDGLETANGIFEAGKWYHVVAINNNGTRSLYINNVQYSLVSGSTYTVNTANTDVLTIGVDYLPSPRYFNGKIDQVRIYNTALNTSQFQADMYNTISALPVNLVAYYNFDNGTAGGTNTGTTTLQDISGNNINGILKNLALTGATSNWIESYAMVVPIATAATNITATGFTANWTMPTLGTVNNYLLDISTNASFSSFVSGYNGLSVSGTSKAVTGLSTAVTYYYRVRADKTSINGQGGYSATIPITTTSTPASALNFDGSNDYITLPTNGIIPQLSTGKVTGSAWINMTSRPNWGSILKNWGDAVSGAFHFGLWSNTGKIAISIIQLNGTQVDVLSPNVLTTNEWHNVAFSADGSRLSLYEDGVLVGSAAYNGTLKLNAPGTFIGVKPNDAGTAASAGVFAGYWNGSIDEVRLWSRGLSACEIEASMNCEFNTSQSGLIAYYKFNQGVDNGNNTSLTTLTDASGNGRNGTLINFGLTGAASNWKANSVVISGVACGVLPVASSSSTNLSICSTELPYSWNGLTFTAAGSQTKTGLVNAVGCDSSASLNLSIKASSTSTTNLTICPSALPFTWNGLTFTAAGSQTKTGLVNAAGCDSTATLNLSVNTTPPNITTEPSNVNVCLNGNTSFNVVATGNGLTYLWQFKPVGDNNWYNADGGAFVSGTYLTKTLSLSNIYSPYDGSSVRCIVFNNCSLTDTSVSANITISSITITSQPVSVSFCNVASGSFKVLASGNGLTYRWQVNKYGTFNDFFYDPYLSGQTTNTLSLNNISYYVGYNNYQYRCIITNACGSVTSNSATLNINLPTSSIISKKVCGSYTWNGVTYTTSGTYSKTFIGANSKGCDSTATLILTIYPVAAVSFGSVNPTVVKGTTTTSLSYSVNTNSLVPTDSFFYKGSRETFVVPTGITSLKIDMAGGQGSNNQFNQSGGLGGRVQATLPVTSGQILNLYVGNGGGLGYVATRWNGGGNASVNGGDASDIRINGTALSNRVVVAGGGGGGGNGYLYHAGAGGGLIGGNASIGSGGPSGTNKDSPMATGGSQIAGGSPGTHSGYGKGTSGILGVGGAAPNTYYTYGGGGGGGYYGGGGGGIGGGGGGSSYTAPSCTNVTHTQGYQSGSGYIKISWNTTLTYSIVWNASALSAGFVNVLDAVLPASSLNVAIPANALGGNTYTGVLTINNGNCSFSNPITITITSPCKTSTSTSSLSICPSQLPFTWNGVTFTAAGTKTAHLTNYCGLDSAATLNLTVKQSSTSSSNASACTNQLPYIWNGLTFTTAGSKTAYLTNAVGCDSAATLVLTLGTSATAAVTIATDSTTICSGTIVTFTANPTNGGTLPIYQWKKNGVNVGTNSNTYLDIALNNNDSVWCVLTSNAPCATIATANSNKIKITVKAGPAIGTSIGGTICTNGGTFTVNNTNTINGGIWSSNDTNIVKVTTATNGASGVAKGLVNGTAILTYTKTNIANGCAAKASCFVVVAAMNTPVITGPDSICQFTTTQLIGNPSGGNWVSVNNRATINATGLIAGANVGIANITYTVTNSNGCSASKSYLPKVNLAPSIPTISLASGSTNPQTGAVPSSAFCQNKTFGLVGSPIGGTWSSTNTAVVTVTNQGVAYTAGIGTGEVIYTVSNTNGCSRSYNTVGNVVACTPRGVNANQTIEQSFTIFPNPAKSLTSLMIDKLTGEGKIIVTDLYGKQVKTQAITIGKNSIDVSKLSKGMYFVSVITTEEKITKKLIVE